MDVFVFDRQSRRTVIVSVSAGVQGNDRSDSPAISADGRFVTFSSTANTLVSNDTNGEPDIFVHDMTTGETARISVHTDGTAANGASDSSSISADGHYVAFASFATNLVSGDSNNVYDVFVRDRWTNTTTRVSSQQWVQGIGSSDFPSLRRQALRGVCLAGG
jgi:Tol biopolymer transport system component